MFWCTCSQGKAQRRNRSKFPSSSHKLSHSWQPSRQLAPCSCGMESQTRRTVQQTTVICIPHVKETNICGYLLWSNCAVRCFSKVCMYKISSLESSRCTGWPSSRFPQTQWKSSIWSWVAHATTMPMESWWKRRSALAPTMSVTTHPVRSLRGGSVWRRDESHFMWFCLDDLRKKKKNTGQK